MLIKGFDKEERNVHRHKTQLDISPFYDKAERKEDPASHRSDRNYFSGAEFKTDLDWKTYPCCGGKGTKWVKKPGLKRRQTLVKCECQNAT